MHLRRYEATLLLDPCVYCAGVAQGLDHIHPKSRKGGTNGWPNRAPACHRCDSTKGSMSLVQFLVRHPLGTCRPNHTPLQLKMLERRSGGGGITPPVLIPGAGHWHLHPARRHQVDLSTDLTPAPTRV